MRSSCQNKRAILIKARTGLFQPTEVNESKIDVEDVINHDSKKCWYTKGQAATTKTVSPKGKRNRMCRARVKNRKGGGCRQNMQICNKDVDERGVTEIPETWLTH
uniref:Uncharacterized protein n=1 Tax=Romanomermis culicivorax TaxID=13658 RepID=A0A915KTP0_ROMCU